MLMNSMNRHLHLSPDPLEGGEGGGAPIESAPAAGGGAPASFDPGAFRNELMGSIRQELGSNFSRFRSEIEPRLTPAQQARQEEKAPTIQSFYNSKGELDEDGFSRFLAAQHKHLSKSERAEWERENQERQTQQQSQSSFRKAQTEHIGRESEYEKANPTYRQDLMSAGDMSVNPQVGQRILASKYSANIIHHFAKNKAEFLRFQAESYDDPAGAIETLGELRAKFASNGQSNGIPPRPTRAAFGGAGTKPHTRSTEEILKEWRN